MASLLKFVASPVTEGHFSAPSFYLAFFTYLTIMRQFLRHSHAALVIALSVGATSLAWSDQTDPVLPSLFQDLQTVTEAADIQRITAEIWQRWSTHPTEDTLTARLTRGVTMMNQGDYIHAEGIFTDIIAEDPNFAEAWNRRATLYFIMGQFGKSRADIAQTLAIEPRHFGALAGLGLIEMHLQNYEAALLAYEEAAAIHPHMGEVNDIITRLQEKVKGLAL